MSAPHTPGPWIYGESDGVGDAGADIFPFEVRGTVEGDDWVIAEIYGDVTGLPAEANARLIAAAPELLADGSVAADMLDMFLRAWAEGKEISDEEGRCATVALMRFNAAIAKARGDAS